jgi:glycosyltransferase involved in cell wall biosynthesis
MKYSVLLPTKDRLEYLRYAIQSVLKQDYANWEIIVSDNCSEDDIQGYITSLNEPRIKYYRTSTFISVTDNWNNALEKSTGDYIIMLGDDDCLLQGYFTTCSSLLNNYGFPEMLYTGSYLYVYPNVIPEVPEGYLETWENASFLSNKQSPYFISPSQRIELVRKTMDFNVMFNFNVQFSLISRQLVDRLKKYGSFYQSPYPDYYATTAAMLKADTVLAVPSRLVAVGMSPKSFGYYYFNNKEKLGNEMLKNIPSDEISQKLKNIFMPGTNMNTSWLCAMETVKQNFSHEMHLRVNYMKYRFLQVLHTYKRFACNEEADFKDLLTMANSLRYWEMLVYFVPFLIACAIRFYPNNSKGKQWAIKMRYAFSHPSHGVPTRFQTKYDNLQDVFEKLTDPHPKT